VWVADSGAGRVVELAGLRPVAAAHRSVAWGLWAGLIAALAVIVAGALVIARRRRRPPGRPAGEAPGTPQAPAEADTPVAGPAQAISRRGLIGGATLLTGAAVGGGNLPASLTRALAASVAAPPRARLADIEHIVILMQENRSFDHYFGTMPGVRGFADPHAMSLPDGRSVFEQPDPSHAQGYLMPFHYDTRTTSAQATPDLDHSWRTQHEAWARGRMDAWVAAKGQHTMGYFTRADIPFHWALAEAFTLCDNYHCSVLGPTDPNRLHMWTGMVDPQGRAGGPVTGDAPTFSGQTLSWTTYPERLERAGVSWQVYQEADNYDNNALAWFTQYLRAPPSSPLYQRGILARPAGTFEDDARADRLPRVSWLIAPTAQSEHPRYFPAAGAEYIAQKLDAIASNRDVWAKTAFILCYDENDGIFDHVPPPTPPPGTPDEFIGGEPIGLGFRVPVTVVSPWTAGGYVSSDLFDHTSLLRLLETRFGVPEPNISAWRRRTCGDLTSVFRLDGAPARYPHQNPRLRLSAAEASLLTAQRQVSQNPAPAVPAVNRPLPKQ
jgi:phospholipase C